MRHAVFVVPGDIETRTGGYVYDRRIVEGLRRLGWRVEVRQPDLSSIADGSLVVVDGLALLAMSEAFVVHARRLTPIALVHLPLSLEFGLSADQAARRDRLERRALSAAALVIATGPPTVEWLMKNGVARQRIVVVGPGTDAAPLARGSADGLLRLVSVAALTPGKGHALLLRALATVPTRRWRLVCAGSLDRDPGTAAQARTIARELGIDASVTFAGELNDDALAALYDGADLFVLATMIETYGMAVAEAIARGVPVVSTATGAIPAIVGGGGLLVAPGDGAALSAALTQAMIDPACRRRLAEGARAARERLRSWDDATRLMAETLSWVGAR